MAKKAASGQGAGGSAGVLLQTGATALGDNTLATTTVHATVQDHGRVTIARGEVTTTAFASTDGSAAYATTGNDVTPINTDVFHSKTTIVSGSGMISEASWSFDATTTKFFAIDNPGNGHKSRDVVSAVVHTTVVEEPPLTVDGNAAHVSLDLTATGENSIVSADAMVLAMHDYSDVNTMLVLGTDNIF